MYVSKTPLFALVPIAALLVGCGSSDPGANPSDGGSTSCTLAAGPLIPWKIGNKWTYKVTEDGVVSQKVTTIEVAEPVGGMGPNATKMAYKVVTKKGTDDQTISWQAPEGDKVLRFREQSFSASTKALELEEHWEPHKLHVDGTAEARADGAHWIENYKETKMPVGGQPATTMPTDVWDVLAPCEVIQVEGKSYDAIKTRKTGGSSSQKTYWYVPGVGKVKETGGQTEELVKFEAAP